MQRHFVEHLVWMLEESDSSIFALCRSGILTCIRTLISRPSGLLFLASQPSPDLVSRLVKYLLHPAHTDKQVGKQAEEEEEVDIHLLGLELATKLEAISHIDKLIAISRKKGEL